MGRISSRFIQTVSRRNHKFFRNGVKKLMYMYGFADCGYVKISNEMNKLCKPCHGDQIGRTSPLEAYHNGESLKDYMLRIMPKYLQNVVIGAQEKYVCIPHAQYNFMLELIDTGKLS